MSERAVRWLQRFVLAVLMLGALEGGARVFVRQILGHARVHAFDGELGWVLKPNVDETSRRADRPHYRIRTNAHGFRSPPVLDAPPGQRGRRVLILGDSNVFGTGVERSQRFDALLSSLVVDGTSVEVINTAVSGWSTDQEMRLLERVGAAFEPDLTLLFVHENDLAGNLSNESSGSWKPRFQLVEGALVLEPPGWRAPASRMRRRSDAFALALAAFSALLPDPPAPKTDAQELLLRLVEHTARAARAADSRFALALQSRPGTPRPASGEWKHAVRRLAVQNAWPLVDLDPVLRHADESAGTYAADDPIHWSAKGHAAVGARICAFLAAELEASVDSCSPPPLVGAAEGR